MRNNSPYLKCIPLLLCAVGASSIAVVSCTDRGADNPLTRDTMQPSGTAIEHSPSLSHTFSTIYYINHDTAVPANSGIYTANVARPERRPVLLGNYQHPSVSPDRDKVGFIDGATIKYFDIPDDSVVTPSISGSFQSAVFADDSLIVGQTNNNYVKNVTGLAQDSVEGYDLSLHDTDTVLFVRKVSDTRYDIIKRAVPGGSEIVFHSVISSSQIRWPAIYQSSNRMVYAVQDGSGYIITTADASNQITYVIDTTAYPKTQMIGFDAVLYTKDDGRFYNSRFDGSFEFRFIPAIGP